MDWTDLSGTSHRCSIGFRSNNKFNYLVWTRLCLRLEAGLSVSFLRTPDTLTRTESIFSAGCEGKGQGGMGVGRVGVI